MEFLIMGTLIALVAMSSLTYGSTRRSGRHGN